MGTNAKKLDFNTLKNAVSGQAAAIRCTTILQPAAGPGTKVFPPTHSGGVYATEARRLPEKDKPGETRVVDCVLLDSVQSQANRIEDALQQAIDDGKLAMPLIVVNFGDAVAEVQRVTSLRLPTAPAATSSGSHESAGHFLESQGLRLVFLPVCFCTLLSSLVPSSSAGRKLYGSRGIVF